MISLINKLLPDPNEKEIKKLTKKYLVHINNLKDEVSKMSDDELKNKFQSYKGHLITDEVIINVYALIRESAYRTLGQFAFDVQIIGALALHFGYIAEMKTGEGKTLVVTFPVCLHALQGKGVHVITQNEYLATRDAEWMSKLYNFLDLSVNSLKRDQKIEQRIDAYKSDITYGTSSEFGFDYLRDNMAHSLENQVQKRGHKFASKPYFAVIDEADSILIDEARTPLILSAPSQESSDKYKLYNKIIKHLVEKEDYTIKEKEKTVLINENGIKKIEKLLNIDNIYTEKGFSEVHHLEKALKANVIFKKDKHYVIKGGEVMIVDEFTGRLQPGRRFSAGLHQAIEAKEGVEIKQESITLAEVTLQNYFRRYEKLCGCTGTAKTEEEELANIYGLPVLVIPTNKPVARIDMSDAIYRSKKGKINAIVKDVKERNIKGQPVLIGTASVIHSEELSHAFTQAGIKHEVLNAKNHAREAEIIANAGQKGSVTIATNMAGRGTDIKLGDGVSELGGLAVIGTERHESRRIDDQLRGRSGRQGDPGFSQFYCSLDDDLLRIFGGSRIQVMMNVVNFPEDKPLQNKYLAKALESAQKRLEGYHFDIRRHLLEYDDVKNKQREIAYQRREQILTMEEDELRELFDKIMKKVILQK